MATFALIHSPRVGPTTWKLAAAFQAEHFHMLVDPAAVTEALLDLARRLGCSHWG